MTITHAPAEQRHADSVLAVKHISPSLLASERELANTKWFDYRFMTPTDATRLFTKAYQAEVRRNYAKYFDLDESELKRGMKSSNLFDNPAKTITSLWTARQAADRLGMPYESFVLSAMKHLMERNYTRVPAPSQLYSVHTLEAVAIAWREASSTFRPTRDPRYKSDHYRGEPAQDSYIESQIQAAERALNKGLDLLLADLVFDKATLPVDKAIAQFGSDTVEKARMNAGMFEHEYSADIDTDDLRPPCHALPVAYDKGSTECMSCSSHSECLQIASEVKVTLEGSIGSADPVAEHKRKLARERQRRRRAKLKAAG